MIESLEPRRLFAAIVVNGTPIADNINVTDLAGPATQITINNVVSLVADGTSIEVNGLGGNDTMVVNAILPTLMRGGDGNDYMMGGNGNDVMLGGNGDDVTVGRNGMDKMLGEGGNDRLYGMNDSDALYGGTGNDYLDAGTGRDEVHAGLGSDRIVVATDGALDKYYRNPAFDVFVGAALEPFDQVLFEL
jgi:Ca2+-binding RTX toxin-like protein